MKESFAPLQRAFDEQNADIAMVNLSLSSYGFMLSTSLIGDSNFRPMITTAFNMGSTAFVIDSSQRIFST
jgi:hypothetical protein